MPNLLVVYDDADPKIGSNSLMCYTHLQNNITPDQHNIVAFDGVNCDCTNIENAITGLQEAPFVFIAYSHGDDDCLKSHVHGEYVNVRNSYFFGASLFYTNACFSGQSLRENLITQNCRAYIGYNDQVQVPDRPDLEALFIECENCAITLFLNTDLSIGECFKKMKDVYDEFCDRLIEQGDIAWALRLALNRGELVFDGDGDTTRSCYL